MLKQERPPPGGSVWGGEVFVWWGFCPRFLWDA